MTSHFSATPADGSQPSQGRVLSQVRQAVEILARGFLSCTANRTLRQKVRDGRLTPGAFYRQVLASAYRLSFLLAVDARRSSPPGEVVLVASATPDLEECRLPCETLAAAIYELAAGAPGAPETFEHQAGVYEGLLDLEPIVDLRTPAFSIDAAGRAHRKAAGCYYTPPALIESLLDSALEPALQEALCTRHPHQAILSLRVCDPACGTGGFLRAASRRMAARLAAVRSRGKPRPGARLLALRDVIRHCIYGADLDAVAVELCRMLLWLDAASGADAPLMSGHRSSSANPNRAACSRHNCGFQQESQRLAACLARHIVSGDALLENVPSRVQETSEQGMATPKRACVTGFDVVLGNPPYSAAVSSRSRAALKERYPIARRAANTAADFLVRCSELAAPAGRVGLVMPKSLTYSQSWEPLRAWLRPGLTHAADVNRAWPDVLLEQVLITFKPPVGRARGRPQLGRFVNGRIHWQTSGPARLMGFLGTIPTGLSEFDERVAAGMLSCSTARLADYCMTRRGTCLQRLLRKSGDVPVLGGRDIAGFRQPSPARFLVLKGALPAGVRFTRPPQAVFQNLVAHVTRPADHIHLIGTVATQRLACLDTVNLLTPSASGLTPFALAGLLMSDLVNWFVYVCVYNRAVRTMHFDGCFLRKIPVPGVDALRGLDGAARRLLNRPASPACWQALNERVYRLYRIRASDAQVIAAQRKPRWAVGHKVQ